MNDIEVLRQEYSDRGISKDSVDPDPLVQFSTWFVQALDSGMPEANAFSLVTATRDGAPSQRTVLLKGHDNSGFFFFTNYSSRKARQLLENNRVSMLFPWYGLHRQVNIEGTAERVDRETSEIYFRSRPRGSQLGAWASRQSEAIESRDALDLRVTEIENRFGVNEIPLPEFWGGYRVIPVRIEFWQGRTFRLHDRILYEKEGAAWKISRLSP